MLEIKNQSNFLKTRMNVVKELSPPTQLLIWPAVRQPC